MESEDTVCPGKSDRRYHSGEGQQGTVLYGFGRKSDTITVLSALGTDVEGLLLDQNRITDISGLPAGIEYKVLALQGNQ